MPKVKAFVSLPSIDSKVEFEFEIHEDDCNEEMIAEMVKNWVDERISFGWEVEED